MPTINSIGTPEITLGGTFTMSGLYSFTGVLTGATDVTFPTSGTLATVDASAQTFDGDSGSATPSSGVITFTGASTGLTFTGSGSTMTLGGALNVGYGGTGLDTLTTYTLLAGGTTSTGNLQQVSAGSSGQLLQSNGASALPTWTTATFPSGSGTLNHMLRSDGTNWVQTTSTTLDSSDNLAGLTSVAVGNLSLSSNQIATTTALFTLSTLNASCSFDNSLSTSNACNVSATQYGNNSLSNLLSFVKNRGSSGSPVVVNTNDIVYQLWAYGNDGTQNWGLAAIKARVTGTVSSGIVPGQLEFVTANSSGSVVTALIISNAQLVTVSQGALNIGSSAGQASSSLTVYTPSATSGSLALTAVNNAGNYANILTNASTSAARTWSLPDATGTIALTSTNGGLIPNSVSLTSVSMAGGNAYFLNNSGATTATLPASGSSTIGDVIKVKGASSAPFIIQANTSQVINMGSASSSSAGTATSYAGTDSIQLVYVATNTWSIDWILSDGITLA
jgi:hypothetical protein